MRRRFQRARRIGRALAMGGVVAMTTGSALVQVAPALSPWGNLSNREVSPMATELLGARPETWLHGETAHFIYHAHDARQIHRAADQTEHAWKQLETWFGPSEGLPKAHLFLIPDREAWDRVAVRHGWPPTAVASHSGQDLFILRDRRDLFAQLVIPHELVHLRVRQTCGEGAPFWAEEGLAEHLSWQMADQYHRERYRHGLHRSLPRVAPEKLTRWADLAALTEYPAEKADALLAVRQVQRMAKSLLESGGPERVQAFIQIFLRDRKPWPEGALELLGVSASDLADREAKSRDLLLAEETEGWQPEATPADDPPALQPRSISSR